MNILHVITSVDPSLGGPIEGIKQLAAAAHLKGHKIEVVSSDDPRSHAARQFPITLHAMGPGNLFYGFNPRLYHWLTKNGHNYDAIIVNGLWQFHSVAVLCASIKSRIRYFVFTHGMLDPWFKKTYPLKHAKKWLYWNLVEHRVLMNARRVIFTTEDEKILARQSFGRYRVNEAVISYGTAGVTNPTCDYKTLLYSQYPRLRGRKLLTFLGRIHPKKGCDLIIEAFSRLLKDSKDWLLVFAGPDQVGLRASLEKRVRSSGISEQTQWLGQVAGDAKWGLLQASEIFMLPSHQENFGVAVAEALSCSTPVLVSNKVNVWREIAADKAGFVCDDTDDGATGALKSWLDLKPSQKVEMRKNSRLSFEHRYEVAIASASLLDVIQQSIQQ